MTGKQQSEWMMHTVPDQKELLFYAMAEPGLIRTLLDVHSVIVNHL